MHIADAQREVRTVFLGGAVGCAVAGPLWLASAALSTWVSPRAGILMLVIGGAFIFPVVQLSLKAMGRPASLSTENAFGQLALQLALMIPLSLPIVAWASLYRLHLFYPAFMIVVGTHYLPFAFLYGMWQFAALGAILIGGGVAVAQLADNSFSAGAWLTGAVLVVAAFAFRYFPSRKRQAGTHG